MKSNSVKKNFLIIDLVKNLKRKLRSIIKNLNKKEFNPRAASPQEIAFWAWLNSNNIICNLLKKVNEL